MLTVPTEPRTILCRCDEYSIGPVHNNICLPLSFSHRFNERRRLPTFWPQSRTAEAGLVSYL